MSVFKVVIQDVAGSFKTEWNADKSMGRSKYTRTKQAFRGPKLSLGTIYSTIQAI